MDGTLGTVHALWREMLSLQANRVGAAVRITMPDGSVVRSADANVDEVLSLFLQRSVRLADTVASNAEFDRADPLEVLRHGIDAEVPMVVGRISGGQPGTSFVDYAPIHLITTSSIDHIGALGGGASIEPQRYRSNIVVRTDAGGFIENSWVGRELSIGDELVLRVEAPTPRCSVPTLAHGKLPRRASALRVLVEHNRVVPLEALGPQPCAGVYARVLRPGRISRGDPISLVFRLGFD